MRRFGSVRSPPVETMVCALVRQSTRINAGGAPKASVRRDFHSDDADEEASYTRTFQTQGIFDARSCGYPHGPFSAGLWRLYDDPASGPGCGRRDG